MPGEMAEGGPTGKNAGLLKVICWTYVSENS